MEGGLPPPLRQCTWLEMDPRSTGLDGPAVQEHLVGSSCSCQHWSQGSQGPGKGQWQTRLGHRKRLLAVLPDTSYKSTSLMLLKHKHIAKGAKGDSAGVEMQNDHLQGVTVQLWQLQVEESPLSGRS